MQLEPCYEIEHEPLASQQLFYDLNSRFQGFSGPIGSGKSKALCVKALKLAYANPGLPGVIGAPTYGMLRDVTRAAFLELLAENEIPHTFRAGDANEVRLHQPESVVRFRSLDNPARLVGSNLAWFALDELTYSKKEAFERMQARLRHKKAKRLVGAAVWTPRGFDWVYEQFVGPEKKPGFECIYAKPFENCKNLADGVYEALGTSYSKRFYEQEVLGQYLPQFAGRAYYSFNRQLHVNPCEYDPSLDLYWSLDFNNSPMCSVIAQIKTETKRSHYDILHNIREDEQVTREFRILDEICLTESNIGEVCREFERRALAYTHLHPYRRPMRVILHGDSSGNNASHAGKSDWELVLRYFRDTPDIEIHKHVPAGNGPVKDRVNAVNGKLLNFRGAVGVQIHPRCKELQKDLEQTAWKADKSENLTEILDQARGRTHMTDAFGYLIVQEEPLKTRGGYSSERLF